MLEAAELMAGINEDMMALGRRGSLEQQPVELNQVVEQALARMPKAAETLVIDLELAKDLMPASGSAPQLLRVVTNLAANAREAMADSGRLHIKTENVCVDQPLGSFDRVQVGKYVRLVVSDSGHGIAPEIRARVFEPFFTTKLKEGRRRGSGLGLSIVQAIVADHGGYLDLESEAGKGSVFSVYLPVSREALKEAPSKELTGGTESILVVDDDHFQRDGAGQVLQALGYRVASVASGEEAVAYLKEHPVDLLMLDMVMPGGIDGVETYRRVLEVRDGQRALIVSGFAETERVREALALGAGGYLRKPLMLDKLARAVRAELDRQR